MSSASKCAVLLALCSSAAALAATPLLRVCADPNNMPYSNQQQQGFENEMAQLIAKDLGMTVSYLWYPQRGTFLKRTLNSGLCDVVMGVPIGIEDAGTTEPYYRSSYVFVSRHDRNLDIASFDDPRLRRLRIGVQVPGAVDSTLPAVHALTSRGIVRNIVGYNIFSDLSQTNPSANLIEAVARKDVDVAIAWGPVASYFAKKSLVPLDIVSIAGDPGNPTLPLTFAIGMGVREDDNNLKQKLDAALERRKPEIHQLLLSYGIPQLTLSSASPRGY